MAEAYQDLLKDTSESKENGNYFLVTITDLIPNTTYPIQFRWVYKDKTTNDSWSSAKLITTPGESEPDTPKFGNESVDVSQPEKIIITWDGTSDNSSAIANYDRVDVYIDGLPFDGAKAAYSFKAPGTAIIPAPAGTYQIVLYAVSKTGTLSPVSSAVTKTVTAIGEVVEPPTNPNGFSSKRILAGIEVSWAGTYASSTFTGFEAINIYAGNSATATNGTYEQVGVLTGNNVKNTIVVPLGTYVAYGQAVYIHAAAVNKNGTVGTIQANVTNQTLGPGKATDADINDGAVVISKLASDVLTVGNLKAGDINATSFIRAGTSSSARVEISSSTVGSVLPGLTVYDSAGTQLLRAPLTGGLTINGGGTFTGNLSVGSENSIFKAEPATGIWLGNAAYASAPFSVSNNGIIKAQSGTIGGWALGTTYLQNASSSPTIKIDTTGITVGATTSSYFDITPSSLTHRNSNGTASGKFTLTLGASPQLTIDGNITINGSSAATSAMLASYATTTDLSTGLATKIGAADVDTNVTSISGGVITTGVIDLDLVNIENAATGARLQISSSGLNAYKLTSAPGVNPPVYTNTVSIGSNGDAFFKGDITGSSGTFSGSLSGATITGATGTFGGVVKVGSSTKYTQLSTNTYGQGSIDFIDGSKSANIYYDSSGWLQTLVSEPGVGFSYINQKAISIELNAPEIFMYGKGEVNNTWGWGSYSTTPSEQTEGSTILSNSIHIRRNNGQVLWLHRYASSGTVELTRFIYNGSDSGGININGSSAAFRTPSDYRLKENIQDYNESMDRIKSIRLRSFNLKSDPDKKEIIGFVAHELSEVDPELVMGEKDAIDSDGNPEYQSIMSGNLVPYLAGALKEAILKIESLESRLDALES